MALAAQVAASCQGRVCAFLLRCRLCKKHAVERRQHTRVTSAANLELGREEAAQKKRALARWQPECKRGRFSSPGSVYVVKVNRWHNSAMHAPQGRAAQPGTGPITSITCCRELRNSIASTFGCGKVSQHSVWVVFVGAAGASAKHRHFPGHAAAHWKQCAAGRVLGIGRVSECSQIEDLVNRLPRDRADAGKVSLRTKGTLACLCLPLAFVFRVCAGRVNRYPRRFTASAVRTVAATPALVYGSFRISRAREGTQDLPAIPQDTWNVLRTGRQLQLLLHPRDSDWCALLEIMKDYWHS